MSRISYAKIKINKQYCAPEFPRQKLTIGAEGGHCFLVSQGESRFGLGRLPLFLTFRRFEGVPPPSPVRVGFGIGQPIHFEAEG